MTERYTIIVTPNSPLTNTQLSKAWLETANEIASITGIFIQAQLDTITLIYAQPIGSEHVDILSGFQIICSRSPYIGATESQYMSSLVDVLNKLSTKVPISLGIMEKENTNLTFKRIN